MGSIQDMKIHTYRDHMMYRKLGDIREDIIYTLSLLILIGVNIVHIKLQS